MSEGLRLCGSYVTNPIASNLTCHAKTHGGVTAIHIDALRP